MRNLFVTILLLFAGTAVNLLADANSVALQKLDLIPNAPLVITSDQASGSPSVILTDKGARINKSTTPVPFDQILARLATLPKEAWPYGRVIFYSPTPLGIPGAVAPPKSVSDKVEADLQKANIRLLRSST